MVYGDILLNKNKYIFYKKVDSIDCLVELNLNISDSG